jgi:hypothetical protein
VLAPKALAHYEPGAFAPGIQSPYNQALKARFNLVIYSNGIRIESRFQRSHHGAIQVLGRCPRLDVNTAPLALHSLIKIIAVDVEVRFQRAR